MIQHRLNWLNQTWLSAYKIIINLPFVSETILIKYLCIQLSFSIHISRWPQNQYICIFTTMQNCANWVLNFLLSYFLSKSTLEICQIYKKKLTEVKWQIHIYQINQVLQIQILFVKYTFTNLQNLPLPPIILCPHLPHHFLQVFFFWLYNALCHGCLDD